MAEQVAGGVQPLLPGLFIAEHHLRLDVRRTRTVRHLEWIQELIGRDVQIQIDAVFLQPGEAVIDRIGKAGIGLSLCRRIEHENLFDRVGADHVVSAHAQFADVGIDHLFQLRGRFPADRT